VAQLNDELEDARSELEEADLDKQVSIENTFYL
jgi:hypothetical protein